MNDDERMGQAYYILLFGKICMAPAFDPAPPCRHCDQRLGRKQCLTRAGVQQTQRMSADNKVGFDQIPF